MIRYNIFAFIALFICALATPLGNNLHGSDSLLGPRDITPEGSVLTDPGYLSAWESVTGTQALNSNQDRDLSTNTKRVVGPIDGRNNYVGLFYRNGRYVITLVMVSDIRGGLKDSLTSTTDVATAVANNARQIMGYAGAWSSVSWAYYSNVAYDQGFTIVAKNLMARGLQDYKKAKAMAVALATAYGIPEGGIFWAYPQNNKRSVQAEEEMTDFTILSNFSPTVELADFLIKTFHSVNSTISTDSGVGATLSKRGTCTDNNEKERIKSNWVPWNTQNDAGCVGDPSEF